MFFFLWHSFRLSLFHNTLPVYYGSSELSFVGNLVQLFIMNWIMVVMFGLFVGWLTCNYAAPFPMALLKGVVVEMCSPCFDTLLTLLVWFMKNVSSVLIESYWWNKETLDYGRKKGTVIFKCLFCASYSARPSYMDCLEL